jgi:hypothetical protein
MKPISTFYKGYRFRSRLEARWAIFFEALGADWVYEQEGFDLSGIWYLPDFWIADWNAWIEIKPIEPNADDYKKCLSLARQSQKTFLLVYGEPWAEEETSKYDIHMFGPDPFQVEKAIQPESMGEDVDDCGCRCQFATGRKCSDEIWLVSNDGCAFAIRPVPHERDEKYPLVGAWSSKLVQAFKLARSARFEHGETGNS